jgi:Domain of unknown function (DUF1996)
MRSLGPAILTLFAPAVASAGSPGWITECPYSHSAPDDPIRFPGQPGASHLHDFFGVTTTSYRSTYGSLQVGPTTCGTKADTSAYWAPALYRKGVKINPAGSFHGRNTREKFYYRDDHYATAVKVEPFPRNFKMIQGYGMATSVADANAHGAGWGGTSWWGCSDNSVGGKPTMPADCKVGIITLHITFPSCWDGVMVPGDEVAAGHVVFPDNKACPKGFPHALPMLIDRLEYPVGTSSSGITLSSGPPYTAHVDFWNAWQQPALSSLTTRCLNGDVNCGTDP